MGKTLAVVGGALLILLDIVNGTPGAALIGGCILFGAALIASQFKPPLDLPPDR
jgi:hypothetical protein